MSNEPPTRTGTSVQLVHRGTVPVTHIEGRNIPIGIGSGEILRGEPVSSPTAGAANKVGTVENGVTPRKKYHWAFMHGISKLSEAKRTWSRIRQKRNIKGDEWLQLRLLQGVRRYRAKFPEKARARDIARNAIRRGEIIRPDHCQNCNKPCSPDAHHEDYSKPLEVIFLCDECHGKTRLRSNRNKHRRLTFTKSI